MLSITGQSDIFNEPRVTLKFKPGKNKMQNEYDLRDLESLKIDPHTWLRTLLAIAGDKEKKEEVIQIVADQSGFSLEQVEELIGVTINVLVTDTRSN